MSLNCLGGQGLDRDIAGKWDPAMKGEIRFLGCSAHDFLSRGCMCTERGHMLLSETFI